MGLYFQSVDAIALAAATAKSVVELSTPAGSDIEIKEWWVEFDGVTATAVPVKVEVGRFSAVVTTATTLAAAKLTNTASPAAATTFKHSTSTEGAGTASDVLIHRIPPTSGYHYVAPLGQEFYVAVSGFWRIRLTAAAVVNACVGVSWQE